jgi:uncharacterized protein (DUF1684 family)
MNKLDDFRKMKDDFFAHHPVSPLTAKQKRNFKGLDYFPEDPAMRMETQVEEFPVKNEVQMQTTTGEIQTFERIGRIHFVVENQKAEQTIYYSDTGYFIPFVDSQAGKETYPAGRYIEPDSLGKGRFLVDFNLAYNPSCAYNEHWSCPITPLENRLKVPIRAGEKLYEEHSG